MKFRANAVVRVGCDIPANRARRFRCLSTCANLNLRCSTYFYELAETIEGPLSTVQLFFNQKPSDLLLDAIRLNPADTDALNESAPRVRPRIPPPSLVPTAGLGWRAVIPRVPVRGDHRRLVAVREAQTRIDSRLAAAIPVAAVSQNIQEAVPFRRAFRGATAQGVHA